MAAEATSPPPPPQPQSGSSRSGISTPSTTETAEREDPLPAEAKGDPHTAEADAEDPLASAPDAADPSLQRELASIHRSDLTLVCSAVEVQMLRDRYGIAAEKLTYAPFFVERERCGCCECVCGGVGGEGGMG